MKHFLKSFKHVALLSISLLTCSVTQAAPQVIGYSGSLTTREHTFSPGKPTLGGRTLLGTHMIYEITDEVITSVMKLDTWVQPDPVTGRSRKYFAMDQKAALDLDADLVGKNRTEVLGTFSFSGSPAIPLLGSTAADGKLHHFGLFPTTSMHKQGTQTKVRQYTGKLARNPRLSGPVDLQTLVNTLLGRLSAKGYHDYDSETHTAVRENKLFLIGTLNSQSLRRITSALDKNPAVDTLVFTANPGSADDETTFLLGREIRRRGLKTHALADSVLASGAVDLFLSGTSRTMEQGARFGVHSWSDGEKTATDYPRDHQAHNLNATYVRDLLGTDAFYWFTIEAAPFDGMHWMTAAEIQQYNMLTAPVLPASMERVPFSRFAASRMQILGE